MPEPLVRCILSRYAFSQICAGESRQLFLNVRQAQTVFARCRYDESELPEEMQCLFFSLDLADAYAWWLDGGAL